MRIAIRDPDALRAISPAALSAFARSGGWVRTEAFGANADVYSAEGRPEIVVPRHDRVADYATAVARLIDVFSQESGTDELVTYRSLATADKDVIRVRAIGADDAGSVQIDAGVGIVTNARNMIQAAACAVHNPQPYYRLGANRDAVEFMRRVKLGQTEQGSFVVTLLNSVPPPIEPLLDPSWSTMVDEPFERLVTHRLNGALAASRAAVEQVLAGDRAAFESAVQSGVSANLCDALSQLIQSSQGLEVGISWARTRPALHQRRPISFSQTDGEILEEAARIFRQRQPLEDITLLGTVHKLSRDENATDGEISVRALIDDKPQAVSAFLDSNAYAIALRAHSDREPVILTGNIKRIGQRWRMDYPNLRTLPAEEETGTEGTG